MIRPGLVGSRWERRRLKALASAFVAPSNGPAAGGQAVIISGTNFTAATWVSFSGTAAPSFTVNSATQITVITPAHAAGNTHVRVNTPSGTSAVVAADIYTFN